MEREQAAAILDILDQLPGPDRAAVRSFAEFLLYKARQDARAPLPPSGGEAAPVPEPRVIPRPDDEKVVAAVKRLSRTYYMLDKAKMLGATSELVTQHVLQGRDAAEVIDELEQLFLSHYQELKRSRG